MSIHTFTPGQTVQILQAGAWVGPFTVHATTGGRTADHIILTGPSGPFELYNDAPYNVRIAPDAHDAAGVPDGHLFTVRSSAPNEPGTWVREVWGCDVDGCDETRVRRVPITPDAAPVATDSCDRCGQLIVPASDATPCRTCKSTTSTPVTVAPHVALVAHDVRAECPQCGARDLSEEGRDGVCDACQSVADVTATIDATRGNKLDAADAADATPVVNPHASDALALFVGALYNGGASIWTGGELSTGYLVGIPALAPNPGSFPASTIRALANGERQAAADTLIGEWIPAVRDVDYVATIGSWIDTDTDRIYFDASSHHTTLEDAASAARDRNELAIWDVANGVEIRTYYACDACGTEIVTTRVADSSGDPIRVCAACLADDYARTRPGILRATGPIPPRRSWIARFLNR